jgi:hypothetical protein
MLKQWPSEEKNVLAGDNPPSTLISVHGPLPSETLRLPQIERKQNLVKKYKNWSILGYFWHQFPTALSTKGFGAMSGSHDGSRMEQGLSTNAEKTSSSAETNGKFLGVSEIEVAEGAALVPSDNLALTDKEKEEIKEKNPNVIDWDGPNDPG